MENISIIGLFIAPSIVFLFLIWGYLWSQRGKKKEGGVSLSKEHLDLALQKDTMPHVPLKDEAQFKKDYVELREWYEKEGYHMLDLWPSKLYPYWSAIVKNRSGDKFQFQKWYEAEGDKKAFLWANWEYWTENVKGK